MSSINGSWVTQMHWKAIRAVENVKEGVNKGYRLTERRRPGLSNREPHPTHAQLPRHYTWVALRACDCESATVQSRQVTVCIGSYLWALAGEIGRLLGSLVTTFFSGTLLLLRVSG